MPTDAERRLQEVIAAIRPLDAQAVREAAERQDRLAKPERALGALEEVSVRLAGIQAACPPWPLNRPAVVVFAGDHGVHARGVTAWPQEATVALVENVRAENAAVSVLARQVGAEVFVADLGVAADLPGSRGLFDHKLRPSTTDLAAGPAMSRTEAVDGLLAGIAVAEELADRRHDCLLTGALGVAGGTASAALVAAFTGAAPAELFGGTGTETGADRPDHLPDDHAVAATEAVQHALAERPPGADPVDTLASLGGFEHAGLAGFVLGAAARALPVVLDGAAAAAATLVAGALAGHAVDYCFAGHRGDEPGHRTALDRLGLRPLTALEVTVGEGTGAVLAFPVLAAAGATLREMATLEEAGVGRQDGPA